MQSWTFFIEQLTNGAWHVGWREGSDDYGRLPPTRAGFSTYAEAEKFAMTTLRDLMLSGPSAIIKTLPVPTAELEAFLRALKKRIQEAEHGTR